MLKLIGSSLGGVTKFPTPQNTFQRKDTRKRMLCEGQVSLGHNFKQGYVCGYYEWGEALGKDLCAKDTLFLLTLFQIPTRRSRVDFAACAKVMQI